MSAPTNVDELPEVLRLREVAALVHSFCDGRCGEAKPLVGDEWRDRIPPWR